MVREVLIVRPSACARHSRTRPDARRVAQRIGAYLVAADRRPDGIVAAPDRRSRRLARSAAKVLGLAPAAVGPTPRLRQPGGEDLLAALHLLGGERLLAVGEIDDLGLPAGPLLAIDATAPSGPRVREVVGHDDLPRTFPFPTPWGFEARARPAYQYFQSGVVPYRERRDGPEILLVTNREGTKWGIPKGIHEPGYSAAGSAEKEAFEEAGVLGEVEDQVLGSYEIEKWGGTCSVTVFPLRVTRMLGKGAWKESWRRRSWVPADRAARKVKKRGLARLVESFARTLADR